MYGHAWADFEGIGGWSGLKDTIDAFGEKNLLTAAVPDLKGIDPDDSFSRVPYEKGVNLLRYIEDILGGPGKFLLNTF